MLRRFAEAAVHALDLQLSAERGHPVTESPIDRLLGGPEAGDRLAALVRVVELDTHELGEDSVARVRRQDADDGHSGGRDDCAGNRELELERAGAGDDLAVLLGNEHALGPEHAGETANGLLARCTPEVVRDRGDPARELLRLRLPDLHAHTFSSGAYSSMSRRSTPSSAKRTVTIPSAAIAVTTPSPRVEWRTESPVERDGTSRRTVTIGAP